MRPPDDAQLLTEYTARHSEDAFTELVGRHVGLVYSAALRQVGEPALAEEVTRALEKQRKGFAQRGVNSTTAILTGAVSANSVSAAPAGLAQTISAVALTKGAAAGGSTLVYQAAVAAGKAGIT